LPNGLPEREQLPEEEVIGAFDDDGSRPRRAICHRLQRGRGAVCVTRARREENVEVSVRKGRELDHGDGRSDESERGDGGLARRHERRHPRPERISEDRQRAARGQVAMQQGHRRSQIRLFAFASSVDTGRASDTSKVEAEGPNALLPGDLRRAYDDGIVHVSAVERVGVTEDQARRSALGQPELTLEHDLGRDVNLYDVFQIDTPPLDKPDRDRLDPQTLEGRWGIFKRDRSSQNRLLS
jgi:hypothetical protein